MARAKEFDRDVALERAMNLFWEQGYESASMRDLLSAMEIGRQSLYDTFGDKHSLFVASLEHYCEMGMSTIVARLSAADGGLRAIEEYFEGMARHMSEKPNRSCLVINTAVELAPHDPEVADVVNRFVESLHQGFVDALEVAVRDGEARVDDIDATAWYLTNNAMGLGPLSKARIPYESLKSIPEAILKTIRE